MDNDSRQPRPAIQQCRQVFRQEILSIDVGASVEQPVVLQPKSQRTEDKTEYLKML